MKRFGWLALLSIWLALPVFAQTAKVIALSPEDAVRSKRVHQELSAAQKAVDEFNAHVQSTYLQVSAHGSTETKDGWLFGFEYSDDWIYIVPKTYVSWPGAITITAPAPALMPYTCWNPCNCPYSINSTSSTMCGSSLQVAPMSTSEIHLNGTVWKLTDLAPLQATN